MADWKKVEQTTETSVETEAVAGPKKQKKADAKAKKAAAKEQKKQEKLIAYGKKLKAREAERNARVSKYGNRRGRYKWAAPVGFLVSVLALICVIVIPIGIVSWARSDAAVKTEKMHDDMLYFLKPITTYNPVPEFDTINEEDHDELLRAAVWRITEAERVRMLREKDDNTAYELDNNSRLIVPVAEVEASYQYLFGKNAVLNHRTLGDDDVEYSEANTCYYVPFDFITTLYQPVIDTVYRRGGEYWVRVGYVSINSLEVDERGETLAPTADMAEFSQIFVLKKEEGHYIVASVGSEAE